MVCIRPGGEEVLLPGRRVMDVCVSIAHCKKVVFTFLPFTFLPFGDGTEDLEEGDSHFSYWERALHIANPLTLPFYLLPFYLLREDRRYRNASQALWLRRQYGKQDRT